MAWLPTVSLSGGWGALGVGYAVEAVRSGRP